MFGFLKDRAEKKARKAELQRLAVSAAEEINDATDEWFAKVEAVSQELLAKLGEFLTDLTLIEGDTPRETAESWLLEIVEMWREMRPEMEARGRDFLSEQFDISEQIGVGWKMEEVFARKFDEAEFSFKARAVIAAGEAADQAEGKLETRNS